MTGFRDSEPTTMGEQPKPVLIACPANDELVPTGLKVLELGALGDDNLLVACASCGADHQWRAFEAVFAPH